MGDKRLEIWRENSWFLDHDNDPAQAALSPSSFSRRAKLQKNPRPLHSPDFSPEDFPCSRNLGIPEGRRFQSADEIKQKSAV